MKTVSELMDVVHDRGGKVTPQRLVIYEILQGNQSHPTAEAIYDRASAILPTISLTTVYKTLNELVAAGELTRFDVAGITHFDPDITPHAEAVCIACQAVVDVPGVVPDPSDVGSGFEVVRTAVTFYGYCGSCAARRLDEAGMASPNGRVQSDAEVMGQ
jgi:Fur family peroxide stress response transcriptional regulator